MKDYSKNSIYSYELVKDALHKLNNVPDNLTLFVLNKKEQIVGALTDGDIRRGLLAGKSINDKVDTFMFKDFKYLPGNNIKLEKIKELRELGIKLVPLLNEDKNITGIFDLTKKKTILPVDAVIMAGGKGERLRPLTDDIPKPLLKIGDKPIVEHNIDRLITYGIDNIYFTVGCMGEKIIEYFGNGRAKGVNINYVNETKPSGTIGSISHIEQFYNDTILVMNSDLLTTIDYEDFYKAFLEQNVDMAVATTPYKIDIPFAILEIKNKQIQSIKEKPTYTYYSNAGIYLIKREIIDLIPKDKPFDATDLIELMIKKGKKVTHFPILGYWLDIGGKEDLLKAQQDIQLLKL